MKKIIRFFVPLLLLIFVMTSSPIQIKAQSKGSISFQVFYDDLSPYGSWINYPELGYVWQPTAMRGFRPYSTNGHWVWSDEYEWVWVSDYDWGWAPFHYGRWRHDPYYGWLWVPGYEWSPAWVAWRSGGDYYGWAPLDPGISIDINFSSGNYSPPNDYWSFAPRRYITSPRIYDYYVNTQQNITIINNTTIINNNNIYGRRKNVFVNGPHRNEAELYTRERIRPVSFRESSKPGRTAIRNNEVAIYRPKINVVDKNTVKPANIVPVEKAKRIDRDNSIQQEKIQPDQQQRMQPNKQDRIQPIQQERTQPIKQERTQPVQQDRMQPNKQERTQPVKQERTQPVQPDRMQPIKQERTQPVQQERMQPVKPVNQKRKDNG